ncbi:MAG: hypothetical protein WKI48_00885 [Aquificaceae bacterium]
MAKFELIKRLWLDALFDEKTARSLPQDSQELEKALSWYRIFKKDFEIYNLRNAYLEEILRVKEPKQIPKEELNQYYRAFVERLWYEGRIRKAVGKVI